MRKTQKEMRFSQCIALIDGLLVGLLYIWDIPLDAASFIALTMAIGSLSVRKRCFLFVRFLL